MSQQWQILAVDDLQEWLDEIVDALPKRLFTVTPVTSFDAARQELDNAAARGKLYDLIVTDLELSPVTGVYGGVNVIKHVRSISTDIPIIILSQHRLPIEVADQLFYEYRCRGLPKPEGISRLFERATVALSAKQQAQNVVVTEHEAQVRAIGTVTRLPGSECKYLLTTLMETFDRSTLEQMLRLELDVDLHAIADSDTNLTNMLFNVISWSEKKGRLAELIRGAVVYAPYSTKLRQFAGSVGVDVPLV